MYQTRNKSIPWDDNVHSIRGLEEHTSSSSSSHQQNDESNSTSTTTTTNNTSNVTTPSSKTTSLSSAYSRNRYKVIHAVLQEQTRLRDTIEGRKEVCLAAKWYGISQIELRRELLRGISCSLSKLDKQRGIQIGQKDEKEVHMMNRNYTGGIAFMNFTPNSRRRYLSMVKGKINEWANTSNKSINSDRSTTSSNLSLNTNNNETSVPQNHQQQQQPSILFFRNNNNNNNSRHRRKSIDQNDDDNDDDNDDNNHHDNNIITNDDVDETITATSTTTTWRQNKSPLDIIQQVVYETSKQFK
jgi:hypothetical protein